jgi:hypothetical protein
MAEGENTVFTKHSAAILIMFALALAPAASGQDRPSPFGASARRAPAVVGDTGDVDNNTANQNAAPLAASQEPFPAEASAMQQAELAWRTAKNRLEDMGSGCVLNGAQIIDNAKAAKLRAVAAYAAYYQKVVEYWTKIRDGSGEAEITGRAESAELQAHLGQIEREASLIARRKSDLERSLNENQVAGDHKALDDLSRLQENKVEQVEKARAALEQNQLGRSYILKRRDYAGQRLDEAKELLQALRTEGYLYQQLYSTIGHRHSLACDGEVPHPQGFPSTWRQDVKKLGSQDPDDR